MQEDEEKVVGAVAVEFGHGVQIGGIAAAFKQVFYTLLQPVCQRLDPLCLTGAVCDSGAHLSPLRELIPLPRPG